MTTIETQTLADQARAAWLATMAENQAEGDRRRNEQAERLADYARDTLSRRLTIKPAAITVDRDEDGNPTRAIAEIDGLRFGIVEHTHGERGWLWHLQLLTTCPKCEQEVGREVESMASLGGALSNPNLPAHSTQNPRFIDEMCNGSSTWLRNPDFSTPIPTTPAERAYLDSLRALLAEEEF